MPRFDTVVKNGMIIDGTRAPRYRGDIGIKDGRIAEIGNLDAGDGASEIDASSLIVAPGFIDLHTHYDAQIFWDPHCSISGWHGVTSVAIGNCGFGFAPVRPEQRERAMLTMTRLECIPYASMKAGLPWDWVTFPQFLDSLETAAQGHQSAALCPARPAHHVGDRKSRGGQASGAHRHRRARDSPPFQRSDGRRRMRLVGAALAPGRSGLPPVRL